MKKVIATYEALFKEQWSNHGRRSSQDHVFLRKTGNNMKKRHDKHRPRTSDKGSCKYHPGLHSHDTKDCLLSATDKAKIDKIYKQYGPSAKFCFTCKVANFKKGEHVCPGKANKKRRTNDKDVVPVSDLVSDSSSDDEMTDSHMTFSALAIDDKKPDNCKSINSIDFLTPPANLMKNNSLILPITLESHHCIIKTYFLLDTSASFSCISPALADILKVEINKSDVGTIKTCQRDNVVERMGSTVEKLKLTYNSRACKANLEVFDIFNGLHVVIGMDLITQFGITISNIAMDWEDDNNLEIPPIDPEPYNAGAAVKSAKGIIIKMLEGRAENWDLYLDGTAYCLNCHKSRLHGMMPFVVVVAKLPNELKGYSKVQAVLPDQEIDIKALKKKIEMIDKILVPAIREQIVKAKEADNAYFKKKP